MSTSWPGTPNGWRRTSARLRRSAPSTWLIIVQPRGAPIGWGAAGPATGLLEPEAIAVMSRLLEAVPLDSGTAESAFVRSGGAPWFLAIARVVPQEGVPPGASDADLPRLIVGFRVTTEHVGDIARRFLIDDLTVTPEATPGKDGMALPGVDGRPVAYVNWTSPTPGRAMLGATLWPLVALMVAVSAIVLLVSREMMRSARRLEVALEQARAADRTKTEFLSNVSHELRTPLNGIIGIAQLLLMREQEPEARHMLEILLASGHSQLQLVNGLLDITRIESGSMTLAREPFDPAAVLDDTARLIAPEIAAKRLELRLAIAPAARRTMVGDALAFRQIATNLIGNALKFTDGGQHRRRARRRRGRHAGPRGVRQRRGHRSGRARAHLRALRPGRRRDDPARRRGRPRARDHPRARRADARLDPGHEHPRRGRDLHRRAAAGAAGRAGLGGVTAGRGRRARRGLISRGRRTY